MSVYLLAVATTVLLAPAPSVAVLVQVANLACQASSLRRGRRVSDDVVRVVAVGIGILLRSSDASPVSADSPLSGTQVPVLRAALDPGTLVTATVADTYLYNGTASLQGRVAVPVGNDGIAAFDDLIIHLQDGSLEGLVRLRFAADGGGEVLTNFFYVRVPRCGSTACVPQPVQPTAGPSTPDLFMCIRALCVGDGASALLYYPTYTASVKLPSVSCALLDAFVDEAIRQVDRGQRTTDLVGPEIEKGFRNNFCRSAEGQGQYVTELLIDAFEQQVAPVIARTFVQRLTPQLTAFVNRTFGTCPTG